MNVYFDEDKGLTKWEAEILYLIIDWYKYCFIKHNIAHQPMRVISIYV